MARTLVVALLTALLVAGLLWGLVVTPKSDDLSEKTVRLEALEARVAELEADKSELEGRVADLDTMLRETRTAAEDLEASRAELEERYSDAEARSAELEKRREELEQRLTAKREELERLQATQTQLVSRLQDQIDKGQIEIQRIRDRLQVDLVDDILFASGEANLSPEGEAVLREVGEVLRDVEGKRIEVQGHTDNVQIRGRLAETYATNWELSAARAVNVVRFLQEETGVDPVKLSAVGLSKFRPRASNETEDGRQQNRRIEILLSPDLVL